VSEKSEPTPPESAVDPDSTDPGATDLVVSAAEEQDADLTPAPPSATTVEAVVRQQLATALGGRRGMAEAAAPTILFTVMWLTTRELDLALKVSIGAAVLLLVIRLVQRSTIQFVVNAMLGIGLGWFFVHRSAASGDSVEDQALAYFLPGILYNAGYTVVLALTVLIRWPLVGLMVGSVTGELTEWRRDKGLVRLCSQLTWLLVLPCAIRVAVQLPIWLAGKSGGMNADTAIAVLGVSKIVMGWPLQLAALGAMVWLLSRDRTPVSDTAEPGSSDADAPGAQSSVR
jgi:hypothetical protein